MNRRALLQSLDITVVDFAGSARALQTVVGGSADVVSGAFEHTVNMRHKGQRVRAFVLQGRAPQTVLVHHRRRHSAGRGGGDAVSADRRDEQPRPRDHGAEQALANGIVLANKWIQTAGPGDIINNVPESFLLGNRAVYIDAEVARTIKAHRLTQQGAAELLGVDQSKVSRITRGQFCGVSEAKLMELATRLGRDVKIVVGPVRRRAGKIELQFA
mgnify:CR=1 FL=1